MIWSKDTSLNTSGGKSRGEYSHGNAPATLCVLRASGQRTDGSPPTQPGPQGADFRIDHGETVNRLEAVRQIGMATHDCTEPGGPRAPRSEDRHDPTPRAAREVAQLDKPMDRIFKLRMLAFGERYASTEWVRSVLRRGIRAACGQPVWNFTGFLRSTFVMYAQFTMPN